MRNDAPAISTQSRFLVSTEKTDAPLLAAPEEVALMLLVTSAARLLASGVGMTLVSIVVVGPLVFLTSNFELLIVLLGGELLVVASAVTIARWE
jgi:hypothetical protein